MASPSKKSLRAAALAEERPCAQSSTEDSTANHLLKLASELKERIEVLRILDGTAPQWPGITTCIDMLYDVAVEASEGLQQACQSTQKSKHALEEVSAKLQVQKFRADEAEDALVESNNENSALTAEIQRRQTTVSRLQSEIADERLERERKVCYLQSCCSTTTHFHRAVFQAAVNGHNRFSSAVIKHFCTEASTFHRWKYNSCQYVEAVLVVWAPLAH